MRALPRAPRVGHRRAVGLADAADRQIAAQCLAAPTGVDRAPLTSAAPRSRTGRARRGAGRRGRRRHRTVEIVIAALEDPATCGAAVAAIGRLGDAVLPHVATALATATVPVPAATVRLARGVRNASPEAAADVPRPARRASATASSASRSARRSQPRAWTPRRWRRSSSRRLRTDAEHAARCLAALAAVAPAPLLERALRDELELLRERVLALLAVRHGAEAIHLVALGLASDAEGRRSLAIEMLDVTLGRAEAALASPVVRTDLPDADRLHQLAGSLRMLRAIAPRRSPTSSTTRKGTGDRPGWQACAVYEARGAGSFAPARRAADASDPVLRETLEWAARRAAE